MKRRLALIITGLALAAAVALLIAIRPAPGDTCRYQGKTVRQWLEQVFTTNQTAALDAFRHMGTNAFPGIVREFKRKDPWWNGLHQRLYPRFPDWLKRRLPPPVPQANIWSAAELVFLNNHRDIDPRQFSELVQLFGNANSNVRRCLFSSLDSMAGPRHRASVPALTILAHDDNPDTRAMAAYLVWKIDGQTNEAVAALHAAMNSPGPSYMKDWAPIYLFVINPHDQSLIPVFVANLSNTNIGMRRNAVNILGQYGPAASNAIPALTNLLNSPDRYFRHQVLDSLKSVDPQTAAKYEQP